MAKKELSCGAVLYRKKDDLPLFLLLHYPSGHWDFAKGHIEENETAHMCARREIKEETGIKELTFKEGFEEKLHYFFTRKRQLISKEVIYALAETTERNITLSLEHKDFAWLPYNKALDKLTFASSKNILKKAEEFLKKKNQ